MQSFRLSRKFMVLLVLMLAISLIAVPAAFACGDDHEGEDHTCEGGQGGSDSKGGSGAGTGDGEGSKGGLMKQTGKK